MKQLICGVIFLGSLCHFAGAQAIETATRTPRQQVSVQLGADFTRKVTDAGITYKPTSSGAAEVGYRFNINRWLGAEGDFDFFRDSQKFILSSTTASLKTNVSVATGSVVINLPNPITKRFKSFATVGGGAMIFNPTGTDFTAVQSRNVIAFGGGADFPVTRHIAIRGQAKTFLYKAPDFKMSDLHTSKYVQTMVPSVGLVFSF
ncbi:outer membrane protein [Granulicella arctica]|uniref:Opacity protein-like surface antigen n=1 Tax=Granulicella arctica TaxID=940613 RepID=A0A7Y9PF04_9BACT|nr:outer membrane beta-barrel protein [Granulicella arctica]NYF78587.1 opacity protein-like surface antigen [Granulicella arctica]